ncbi:MAG: GntR family transcriptional regulator [Firmicutes bacterium]|nr:GntR family transcriptional regulator [Bacillota bacterium]
MFTIDYKSRKPIYRQIVENIENLAAHGVLQPDEQLPSVRALAVELSANPNTVAKAYSELEAAGVIYSLPGRGSFLASDGEKLRRQAIEQLAEKMKALAESSFHMAMSREEFLAMAIRAWQNTEETEVANSDRK